jgi:hypothetical protein
MKLILKRILPLLLSVSLSVCLLGCAPNLSNYKYTEIADETEVQGCQKMGLVTGASYWGGFSGQNLSLEVAKKRALQQAQTKGATHVLWLTLKKGFFGASVSGKAYCCPANTKTMVDNAPKIIPLAKSVTPKQDSTAGAVAVMRFESVGIDSGVSLVVTDIFTNQIQADGKYRVMERSQINKILREQGFISSGVCNAPECAVQIGRLLSIDKMFIGSIGKLGESWVINIRMINVQTGEIVSDLSKQVIGTAENLSPAALQMANEFSQ